MQQLSLLLVSPNKEKKIPWSKCCSGCRERRSPSNIAREALDSQRVKRLKKILMLILNNGSFESYHTPSIQATMFLWPSFTNPEGFSVEPLPLTVFGCWTFVLCPDGKQSHISYQLWWAEKLRMISLDRKKTKALTW